MHTYGAQTHTAHIYTEGHTPHMLTHLTQGTHPVTHSRLVLLSAEGHAGSTAAARIKGSAAKNG